MILQPTNKYLEVDIQYKYVKMEVASRKLFTVIAAKMTFCFLTCTGKNVKAVV